MDQGTAERIAERLRGRLPDAQVVDTGGGFVNVYWTQDLEGQLRSFVLGDDNGPLGDGGGWSVDIYRGAYMTDPEALYLFTHEFSDAMQETEVVAILRTLGKGA